MLILIGKMASGKTTTAKLLEKAGYERAVTDTTRPPRPDEKEGVDYHFLSDEEFARNAENGLYAETAAYCTAFGLARYGSRRELYSRPGNRVIVLNPEGFLSAIESGLDFTAAYLRASDGTVRARALARGDSEDEVERRIHADAGAFDEIEHFCDLVVDVDGLTAEQVAEAILSGVRSPEPWSRVPEKARRRRRIEEGVKKENVVRRETPYRSMTAPCILKRDDGTEKRISKHGSNMAVFYKNVSNRKVRRENRADIRSADFEPAGDGCGRCMPVKGRFFVRIFDVKWNIL